MKNLFVKIVCPDGEIYSGEVKSLLATTESGELQVLAGHAPLAAAVATGRAKIAFLDGSEKTASVSGGFLTVSNSEAKLVCTTFEFSDEIDLERARRAKEVAEAKIHNAKDDSELKLAKAKLMRALSRISVADKK